MAVIPLGPTPQDWFEMAQGYMLFPDDKAAAHSYWFYKACFPNLVKLHEHDPIAQAPLVVDQLLMVLCGPTPAALQKRAEKRRRQGLTAGVVLSAMHVMTLKKVTPSVNRACALIAIAHQKKKAFSHGVQLCTDPADIKRAWSAMKPVAHLWAAMGAVWNTVDKHCGAVQLESAVRTAFGLSRSFLEFGANHTEVNVKQPRPLLDRAGAWTVPEQFEPLPLNKLQHEAEPWLEESIRTYKAEARR